MTTPSTPTHGELPQQARAVIIGGGIIGLSVLYHLTRLGWRDVVLLEKNELTSGTTWHSAALVSPMRGTRAQTTLARYSGELYERLRDETGVETGMRRCGHLNIATSQERLKELKHTLTLMHNFGLEGHMVGAAEVADRWPMMRTDDVIAAVWTPSSGRADPSNICHALAKGARAGGAQIIEHVAVTGIARDTGRVRAVMTDRGEIATDIVINCAGLWGREIAAMAGQRAPLFACEHLYLLTEPMAGVTGDLPVFRDGDAHLYGREEVGGLLVGCFEPNPKALPVQNLPKDAAYILLNEDWDHFAPMMEGAIHRIPDLETAGVRMLLNGPESFTQDNAPLMGEAPDLPGFWYCCGMNSAGIVLGGGAGWAMAEWIVNGAPPVDLSGCDIRRFPAALDTARALAERVPEMLSHHFSIRYPGREPETARNLRHSALHDRLVTRGARFGARTGWEKPLFFDPQGKVSTDDLRFGETAWQGNVNREIRAVRTGVALFDQSSFGKFRVEGRDAEAVLQQICAADISGYGRAHYTPVLNDAGGMESDLTVTRLAPTEFLVVTGTAQLVRDLAWFKSHVGDRFVTVTDVTPGLGTILLTGPDAQAALQKITPMDLAAFPFGHAQEIEAGPVRCLAMALSFAGAPGWELHVPTDMMAAVHDALIDAHPAIVHAGAHALNACRLEKGFRSWGHDMGPRETPLEAGLGFAIDWNKPFRGRDALETQRAMGLGKRLLSFTLPGDSWATGHQPLYRNGVLAGELTSAAFSPVLDRTVALGWVETGPMEDAALLADAYEAEIGLERFAATSHLTSPLAAWAKEGII
ncbi:MAG: FAD-dependent oxidoreductase [Rhodobacteraceae bacterium]|nr:FAD-dependent oxidoreductase [Paracoccaceae bacterium]